MVDKVKHSWTKHILPRGIYGRAALILFLPVVTVMLVVSLMFLQRHFDGVTEQMTESAARELSFVARQMENAPDISAALDAGRAVADPLGISIQLPAKVPGQGDSRIFYDFSGRVVIQQLHAQIPEIRAVDLSTDQKRVLVSLTGSHGPYQLSFDRRRASASNPHQLLVLMVFTALVMSGIASVFLRNQLRPIRRLARAAEDYGKGRVVEYRPGGAAEVRSAGAAFLDMRNRLERSNDQRKLMVSGISHDLRTPLTRLKLGLSMIGPGSPPDAEDIADMEADVAEIAHMIEAFLDFARDEAHDSPPQTLEPIPFVRSVVADAQRGGQSVKLVRVVGNDSDLSTFRPDALRRALANLIGNGVRYGTCVEVDVFLGPRSLIVAVEDDGPGIPEDRREEAIRPFTRLDPARSQNPGQGGAGLGLSIAAEVARAHGGHLRLDTGERLGGLRAEIMLPR